MSGLSLSLFGSFSAELNGRFLHKFHTNKVQALLIYLTIENKEAISRNTLMGLLWPDLPRESAQVNLRQTVFQLRKLLPELPDKEKQKAVPFILSERQTIGIHPEAAYTTDAAVFAHYLEKTHTHAHADLMACSTCQKQLEQATFLYQDDFLADFYLADSDIFEEWALLKRESLRRQVLDALETVTAMHLHQGNYHEAQSSAQRQVEIDNLRESGYRQLMESLARDGQRNAALSQYEACRLQLNKELSMLPTARTTRIYTQIKAGELGLTMPQSDKIRGYELLEEIGSGAFGAVYRAYQPAVGREVAIKIILPQYANQPDFIRRFETEAHMVARLEHPHIVPLYDYWREPDGAYLVMRLLRGGNLEDMLQEGPVDLETAVTFVDQIASALAVAHRQGVIHRDLKPANILLDEEGNTYLADFGIAKDLTSEQNLTGIGDIIGSPAYISPEQVLNEPITPMTDIYSFGIILYTLLAGKSPFSGASLAVLIHKHLNEPLPLVGEQNGAIPFQVDEVIQQATAKNPRQRYTDVLTMAHAFHEAVYQTGAGRFLSPAATMAATADLPNPYQGLRPFQETDSDYFFGRDALVEQLLSRLAHTSTRFLAVVGPSGSGKSSAVKAGLIPALRRGAISGSENWFIVEMIPGDHPLEELEASLLHVAVNPPPSLIEPLQKDERGLIRTVKRILPHDQGREKSSELLLLIDQFEELFTLVDDTAVRNHFLDSLVTAVSDPRSRLRIIITLRADFYDRPLQHAGMGELLRQHTELILPLNAAELEQAVSGPTRHIGVTPEPSLIAAITADVNEQPGALPLLQYALTELFERRDGRTMTQAAYEQIGGISSALAQRAEETYTNLDETEQEDARQLFLRLVTLGESVEDTRRRVRLIELQALKSDTPKADRTDNGLDAVIEQYARYRILTLDRDPNTRETTIEVAHEALLREWPRMRHWLDESRDDIRMQRLLAAAAIEWEQLDRDEGFLLRGSRLDLFSNWATTSDLALTSIENTFLNFSQITRQQRKTEEETRRQRELETAQQLAKTEKQRAEEQTHAAHRLRRRNTWLIGALLIALILAIAAATFARQSQQNANVAATRQVEAFSNAELAASREADAIMEANQRATAEAVAIDESARADEQRDNAIASEATAEAEAVFRATAEAVAVEEREEALRQASIGFAAQAVLELEGDSPERAVLLALEALEEYPYTGQAESALMQAVEAFKPYDLLPPPSNLLRMRNAIWSPDGEQVVAVGGEGHIVFWDVNTGEEIASHNERDDLGMASIAWTSDGTRLATTSEILGVARIWDAETGVLLLTFEEHDGAVNSIALSQDGNLALTASADGTARVWETTTGVEQLVLNDHAGGVTDAIWSPEEEQILTASTDGFIRLWDAATGENLRTLAAHASGVLSLTWEPDGTRIATSGMDGIPHVWDMESGESLYTLIGHNAEVRDIDWSPDGGRLATASADGTARVWDTRDGGELFTLYGLTSDLWTVDWSPDGNQLLTGGGLTTRISDVSAQEIRLVGHTDTLIDAQWSPDMSLIVTTGFDGTARTWDAGTGELLATFSNHRHTEPAPQVVGLFSWSPFGNQVVTPGFDGAFRLWDALTGEESLVIPHEEVFPMVAEWSPDGTRVAGGDFGGFAYVWDAETGEELLVMDNDCSFLEPAWSPDGTRIVTSCNVGGDGDVVWDAETGEKLVTFTGHAGQGSNRTNWSPDGTKIISPSPDTTIQIWDAATGEVDQIFSGHTTLLYDAEWSPDGQRIASGDESGMVRIWEAETGVEVYRFEVDGGVLNVEWSPDGTYLIVSGWFLVPEIRRMWSSTEALIDHAYDCCAMRELSPEERMQFGLPLASD